MVELGDLPSGHKIFQQQGGPLYSAVRSQKEDVVEYLCSNGATNYNHVVEEATRNGHSAVLDTFLKHGWHINERLDWAEPPPLSLAVNDSALTNWFLSRGADANARCYLDITPLSRAVNHGQFEVIELMFDHGGSIDHGQLLHCAASRTRDDSLEVLDYLLAKGSPLNDIMY